MCGSIENSVCESPRCFFICIMIGVSDNNNHLNEEVRISNCGKRAASLLISSDLVMCVLKVIL
jgi:hypothetical protein